MNTKLKAPIPGDVAVRTPPTADRRKQLALYKLQSTKRHADELRQKMIKQMTASNNEAVYQLRWAQQLDQNLIEGAWAEDILANVARLEAGEETGWTGVATTEEMLKRYLAIVRDRIDSWRPQFSTSPYSNAINDAEHGALRETARTLALIEEEG